MSTLKTLPNLSFRPEPSTVKYWTVDDYHRMAELGFLRSGERTELIAGQILLMAAKGTPHVTSLHLLGNMLEDELKGVALIRRQDPIQLDDFSEPEPDLVVVRGGVLDYADHHPIASEIYLVVEVADSTLKYDSETKDKVYAQAGILEYWVLDVKGRQLHIFREPSDDGYVSHTILRESAQTSLAAFPNVILAIQTMFAPKSV
jgi:Uma2 family endonuclease